MKAARAFWPDGYVSFIQLNKEELTEPCMLPLIKVFHIELHICRMIANCPIEAFGTRIGYFGLELNSFTSNRLGVLFNVGHCLPAISFASDARSKV